MQQIEEFLYVLYQQGNLKMCTIEGYKSAIVVTLKVRSVNVGTDPHIAGLLVAST